MPREQTEQEQELWRTVLESRAERMHKLVQLKAPPVILANELILLTKAIAGFSPEHYGKALANEAQTRSRESMGLCVFCGRENHERQMAGENWCETCEAEFKAADDEPS